MSLALSPVLSPVDQVRSIVSSAAALEQSLAEQAVKMDSLAARVTALTAENAALRQRLAETAPPPPADTGVPNPGVPNPGVPDPGVPNPGDPVPDPVPTPPTDPVTEWGFVANETDAPAAFARAFARMKADGGNWLRLWHSGFGSVSPATANLVATAAANGINVILCVQPKDTAAADLGTPDFNGFVKKNAAVLRQLAYLEAGNELNLVQYRPDDLGGQLDWHKPYVDRWLRPLSTALKSIGVKTLCTSVTDTYHPKTYATNYDALLAAGAADCCDGLAVHAYFLPQYLDTLADILANLKAKWAKPIHVTECNVMTAGVTAAQWQERFPAYMAVLRRANVRGVQFYRAFPKTSGKWPWPTLFDKAGTPTDVYATFRAAMTAPQPATATTFAATATAATTTAPSMPIPSVATP